MRIYEEFNFQKYCTITIKQIDCNFENIKNIINIFNFKYISLTIDSLKTSSPIFLLMNSLNLSYKLSSVISDIAEVTVLVPLKFKFRIFEDVINEDPENLFITNLLNNDALENCILEPQQILLTNGQSDLILVVSRDKSIISLTFTKSSYNHKEIMKKLKNLQLR